MVVSKEPCQCGSLLETISVEGRTDEILRVPSSGGGEAVLLPMALATVVEETPGVRRYQVVQTARDALTVRLENNPGTDRMRYGSGSARAWATFSELTTPWSRST